MPPKPYTPHRKAATPESPVIPHTTINILSERPLHHFRDFSLWKSFHRRRWENSFQQAIAALSFIGSSPPD